MWQSGLSAAEMAALNSPDHQPVQQRCVLTITDADGDMAQVVTQDVAHCNGSVHMANHVLLPKQLAPEWLWQKAADALLSASTACRFRPHANDPGMMVGAPDQAPPDEIAMLLARCAEADGAAFRRLYELQSATLYGVALRITRQPALAVDAVHDAMLQVWRNASRFDPARGNAQAWLLSLVRYRALDSVARIGREVIGVELSEVADPDPSPLDCLLATREGTALHRCLQQIEAQRRKLVMLAFVEGLSHTEVAAHVGQPLGSVKSGIRRALLALRSCLDGLT